MSGMTHGSELMDESAEGVRDAATKAIQALLADLTEPYADAISIAAKIAANAIKLIPGIGSVIGGISMSVLSGGSTYALGQVAVGHFEGNGTFANLDLDPEAPAPIYAGTGSDGGAVAAPSQAHGRGGANMPGTG